jgi:hypothetical protein
MTDRLSVRVVLTTRSRCPATRSKPSAQPLALSALVSWGRLTSFCPLDEQSAAE